MMNYDLLVPARTVFGWGRLDELGTLARTQGTKAFVISGSRQFAANGTLRRIDELLAAALKERGVDIARRTVVKYRQQLGIPPARLRKQY